MVRSPPVMSPSSAAQMDSKLPNQGKQGGAGSQSQPSPCDPKSLSGSHTPKGPQGSIGSMGLKNGQGLSSGNGAKGKIKRERSTSVESFEQRDTGTPSNEGDQKGKKQLWKILFRLVKLNLGSGYLECLVHWKNELITCY